jgi:hypothetical protein
MPEITFGLIKYFESRPSTNILKKYWLLHMLPPPQTVIYRQKVKIVIDFKRALYLQVREIPPSPAPLAVTFSFRSQESLIRDVRWRGRPSS